MGITQTHARRRDNFTVHGELKMTWLFQGWMLRPNGDNKRITAYHALLRQFIGVTTFDRLRLLDGKIRPERKYIFGPIICDEQAVTAFCAPDLETQHLMQFAFEERGGRDDIFDGRQCRVAA